MKDVSTIKLLDGTTYDKSVLIDKMNDDSFYYGECGKTMLSSSAAKLLLDSYKKYFYITKYGDNSKPSQALIDGWLFHTAILEPHIFAKQIFVDIKGKNTIKFKEAQKEYGADVRLFTVAERDRAERLADGFLKNSVLVEYLNKAEFEVPIAGDLMGLPFRGKADVITQSGGIIDLKTTTNISQFKWSAKNYCYDLQCYIYCNLFNVSYKDFHFIAIDKDSLVPKFCYVSEQFYYEGEKKCAQAIEEYNSNYGEDLNEYLKYETL